jgi:hypothetical protein
VATGKVEFSSTPDDIVGSNRQILLSYESASPAAMKRVTGVSHHPFKSEVSVFGEEGTLKVLRASS